LTLSGAIAAWRRAIGSQHVVTDAVALRAAEQATYATSQQIAAIIRPGTREEVQACVRIAVAHRTPVHPVSTGRNWGYGSRVPAQSGSVLMELRRMNRIRDFSEELGYVTVEPGVTFTQLHQFLRRQGSQLAVPWTGSSPETSILGNALERGVGLGRYGYRPQHTCALEVVLATGECFRSGTAAFPAAAAAPVHRGGPGPEIEGLFFQSNLGIVTAMTIWLSPVSHHAELCYFAIDHEERLGELVDGLRTLLLQGVVVPVASLRNDYFLLLASQQRYPWEALGEKTPFSPSVLARRNKLLGRYAWWSASWAGFVWLHGVSPRHSAALRDVVTQGLFGRVDRLVFIGNDEPTVSIWAGARDPRLAAGAFSSVRALKVLTGDPGNGNLPSIYWRKRTPLPDHLDPDRDGCGAIFCTPLVPLTGKEVTACTQMVRKTMLAHGFEPFTNVFAIEERCAYVAAMILYDRDVTGEDERALTCHGAILAAACDAGWIPHRLAIGPQLPGGAHREDAPLLNLLKRTLDPHDIVAPGRHGIGT
jgi:4-cresol dehydrogenase (hydroxylating) flavoprotein subunit